MQWSKQQGCSRRAWSTSAALHYCSRAAAALCGRHCVSNRGGCASGSRAADGTHTDVTAGVVPATCNHTKQQSGPPKSTFRRIDCQHGPTSIINESQLNMTVMSPTPATWLRGARSRPYRQTRGSGNGGWDQWARPHETQSARRPQSGYSSKQGENSKADHQSAMACSAAAACHPGVLLCLGWCAATNTSTEPACLPASWLCSVPLLPHPHHQPHYYTDALAMCTPHLVKVALPRLQPGEHRRMVVGCSPAPVCCRRCAHVFRAVAALPPRVLVQQGCIGWVLGQCRCGAASHQSGAAATAAGGEERVGKWAAGHQQRRHLCAVRAKVAKIGSAALPAALRLPHHSHLTRIAGEGNVHLRRAAAAAVGEAGGSAWGRLRM